MDCDFSGLCADQVEKLEKRLDSLKKAFIKEYMVAINVINNARALENRGSIKVQIEDLFDDTKNKSSIFYTECMNKVQKLLISHLS
jgi:hypothetical protein